MTRTLIRPAVRLAAFGISAVALCALAIEAARGGAQTRTELDFAFPTPPRELSSALDMAATNLRLAAATLLASWVVQRYHETRLVADSALGLLATLNLAIVGISLAAYGRRLLESIALHGLLEVAAFALCGSAYLAARRRELTNRQLALAAALATLLLIAAAVSETYLRLGATP